MNFAEIKEWLTISPIPLAEIHDIEEFDLLFLTRLDKICMLAFIIFILILFFKLNKKIRLANRMKTALWSICVMLTLFSAWALVMFVWYWVFMEEVK